MEHEIITSTFFNGSQSVEYKALHVIGKFKIEISIDRDSYDKQSSAIAKVFSTKNMQWNFLCSIPYREMEVVVGNVFCQRKVDKNGRGLTQTEKVAFNRDENNLIYLCTQILTT